MWFIPTIDRFGLAELAAALGLPQKNVRRWIDLDSIPAEWFAPVARAAATRGLTGIDVQYLADRAEARRLDRTARALTDARARA